MKRWFLAAILVISFLVPASLVFAEKIRPPAVAGKFYPSDPVKLEKAIDYYMKSAQPALGPRPVALVAPHAGYVFSGQICADAFNQAAGFDFDLVVLLGTNHTSASFSGVSIFPSGGFQTPLGTAKIDAAVSRKLIGKDPEFTDLLTVHAREHSIEVMVPFVQRLFPEARIVAAVIGKPDMDLCKRFSEALSDVLAELSDRKSLIVASSDFSHYPSYADAVLVDRASLRAIEKMDAPDFKNTLATRLNSGIPGLVTSACGEGPILAAMMAAKSLGANCASVVSHANSGDTAFGSRDRVVGYGAVSFFHGERCPSAIGALTGKNGPDAMSDTSSDLDEHEKQKLLKLARRAIEQYLVSGTIPLARMMEGALAENRGAFVTIKKEGRLRGCIGHMAEDLPLCQVVCAMALNAAFNDRRFPPLALEELEHIEIEISVLTPFCQVGGPEDIQVGRDGVVIKKDGKSAVFLPQVALEQGWNREQMLHHLCRKAGLDSEAWKKDAGFLTFQARVFGEKKAP